MFRIVITSACLIGLAASQAAPLLTPAASATPTAALSSLDLPKRQNLPLRATPTSAGLPQSHSERPTTATIPEPVSALANRMNAALRGERATPQRRATRAHKETTPPKREWTCGNWQELWQGTGSARTCEWR